MFGPDCIDLCVLNSFVFISLRKRELAGHVALIV